MKLGVYSVRDRLSGFLQPSFEINDQVAYRNFEHAVLSGNSLLTSHASDYDLVRIGEFDTESGRLIPADLDIIVSANSIFLRSLSSRKGKEAFSDEV